MSAGGGTRHALGAWLPEAMAQPGQPQRFFAELDRVLEGAIGRRYATILAVHDGTRSQRVFSTVPDTYPVGGRKTLPESSWRQQVVERGLPFLAASEADLDRAYPDAGVVRRLGCGALINAPAIYDGRVVGLLNLADAPGRYAREQVEALLPFAALLAPVLRLHFASSET